MLHINLHKEAIKILHRIAAIVLASTTWLFIWGAGLSTFAMVVGCLISATFEFAAYKMLSTNEISLGAKAAGIFIVIISGALSWIGAGVVKASLDASTNRGTIELLNEFDKRQLQIIEGNRNVISKFQANKEKERSAINAKFDKIQNQIGYKSWRDEFPKAEKWYRKPERHSSIRKWVAQRDSIEQIRFKELDKIDKRVILPGMIQATGNGSGEIGALADGKKRLSELIRTSMRFVEVICAVVILLLTLLGDEEEEEDVANPGMLDFILYVPSSIGSWTTKLFYGDYINFMEKNKAEIVAKNKLADNRKQELEEKASEMELAKINLQKEHTEVLKEQLKLNESLNRTIDEIKGDLNRTRLELKRTKKELKRTRNEQNRTQITVPNESNGYAFVPDNQEENRTRTSSVTVPNVTVPNVTVPNVTVPKICGYGKCENDISNKKANARFCSPTCKAAAHKQKGKRNEGANV